MDRCITVKGIAHVSVPADTAVLNITLNCSHADYGQCMQRSAEKKVQLLEAIRQAGFVEDELKTKFFTINPRYEDECKNNSYREVFAGWECEHELVLRFAFESNLLHKVLLALSRCRSECTFDLSFTVADCSQIQEKLLHDASLNARKKAEILSNAQGCKLGKLLSINYNWHEIDVFSASRYRSSAIAPMAVMSRGKFNPQNIDVDDTAVFVWELI